MAEKILSPGVFTNEIDESFLPAAVGEIGAAIIGPTVKGPSLVPRILEELLNQLDKHGFRNINDAVGSQAPWI